MNICDERRCTEVPSWYFVVSNGIDSSWLEYYCDQHGVTITSTCPKQFRYRTLEEAELELLKRQL